jgi:hypothetical protein
MNATPYQWQPWSKKRVVLSALTASYPFGSRALLPLNLTPGELAAQQERRNARWTELRAWRRLLDLMIDEGPAGKLSPSSHFAELNGDRRRPYSEALGRAMCKLIAGDHFGVPILERAEDLRAAGRLTAAGGAGRRIADLVGVDFTRKWHVFEAKGYAKPTVQNSALEKAVDQARTVATVDGAPPKCSGCVTATLASPLAVGIVDPPPKRNGIDISLTTGDLVVSHYELFAGLLGSRLSEVVTTAGLDFAVLPLDDDLLLGLRADIAEIVVKFGVGEAEPTRAAKRRLGESVLDALHLPPRLNRDHTNIPIDRPLNGENMVLDRDGFALLPGLRSG